MKPYSALPEAQTYGHEELNIRPCFKLIKIKSDRNVGCCRPRPKPKVKIYTERPISADPIYLIKPTAEEVAKIPLNHALVPVEFERAAKAIVEISEDGLSCLTSYWMSCIPTAYMNTPKMLAKARARVAKKRKRNGESPTHKSLLANSLGN